MLKGLVKPSDAHLMDQTASEMGWHSKKNKLRILGITANAETAEQETGLHGTAALQILPSSAHHST